MQSRSPNLGSYDFELLVVCVETRADNFCIAFEADRHAGLQ